MKVQGGAASSLTMALPRKFFARDAETVARDLLGKILVGSAHDAVRRARIVETEAYVGEHDLASHSSRGRTPRNAAMFGRAGHAYIYSIYGMHHCLNVVTGGVGDGQAVLLRAAEPLEGWMARMSGPGLLARAFGITRADNGADLVRGPLRILEGETPPQRIVRAPRVGVDYAGPWATEPLRFCEAKNPLVSRPRPKA